MWAQICESASLHLINSSWNMSNKSVWKWWNDIKAQPSVYRSMKVTGKDTFRHTQTNPPDHLVCLHLIHVFIAQCWPLSVFHLSCLTTSSLVHWSLCRCQVQVSAKFHQGYTNINLPEPFLITHTHADTYTYLHFSLGWSGAIHKAWNVIHSKRLIKCMMIDKLKAGRQNWEWGVNWRG